MTSPAIPKVKPPKPKNRNKSRSRTWATVIAIGLAIIMVAYILVAEAPPPRRVVIAAGPRSGAYYQFALKYAKEFKKEGIAVEVRETAGSVQNLQLLQDDRSGVSVAIVQSGVVEPTERDRFDALGSLYLEPLWVFYRGAKPLDRLSELAGKRIGVGLPGSGTHAIAMQMLAVNGLVETDTQQAIAKTTLVQDNVAAAAEALQKGEVDAAFFVAAFDANYIQDLLKDEKVRLMSFVQHEAYHRKFRFLSQVTVPAGLVNLGENLPRQDIAMLAPTAVLVARKDLHPALVPLFLAAATRIHGLGDELSKPGEFPSASYTDFPVSEHAERFYKYGPPMLQRLLPFWLGSLVDRLKFMVIPLLVLLMPLFRATPPLMRWRARRKIYLWYSVLKEIDQKFFAGMSGPEIDEELTRLADVERQLAFVEVPLSYMDEIYHLRLHLKMVKEELTSLKRLG